MEGIITIANLTLKEALRSKVIYAVLFFAALVVVAAALFGSVSIGDTATVIRDFGLGCISFFSVLYTVIAGSSLLSKELNRKTIFNILSRPLTRGHFIVGKFLGLWVMASILTILMGMVLYSFCYLFEGTFNNGILLSCFFIVLELAIVSALVLLFSAIVITPFLSGTFAFIFFLIGRSVSYIESYYHF